MSRSYITILGILFGALFIGLSVILFPATVHAQCPVNDGQPIRFEVRFDLYRGKREATDGYVYWGISPLEYKNPADRTKYVPPNEGVITEIIACHRQFPSWKIRIEVHSSKDDYTDRPQLKGDQNDAQIVEDRGFALQEILEERNVPISQIERGGSASRTDYPLARVYFIRPASDGDDGESALPSIWVGHYPSHPTAGQIFDSDDHPGHMLKPGDKYTNTDDKNEYVYFKTNDDGRIDWRISSFAAKDAYQPKYLGELRSDPSTAGPGDTYSKSNGDTMINRALQGQVPQWELYIPAGKDGIGEDGDNSFESFRIYGAYSGLQARMTDPVTKIGRDSFLVGFAIDWRIRSWLAATASYKLGYGIGTFPTTEEWGATSTELGVLFIPVRWDTGKVWVPLTGRWDGFESNLPGTNYRLANAAAASGVGVVFAKFFFVEVKVLGGVSQLPYHEQWQVSTENDLSLGGEVNFGVHLGNGF